MRRVNYRCVVCGRVFSKGQGLVIKHGEVLLTFHKSRCASRFLRHLLESSPYEEIGKHVKSVVEFFEKRLEKDLETRAKKI